jgi:uncharacterized protein
MASVSQFVLKVHSRCNLACDHCYVYEHADHSWRDKPAAILPATADVAARRVAEHAAAHQLPQINVVVHGGEPLLLGYDGMRQVLASLQTQIAGRARLNLRVLTNGVRLNERWCTLFDEYRVKVGISLDGGQAANDRHRRFRNGESSYPQTSRALALLRRPEHRHLYAGILCTVDLRNDPIAVYEALVAERPPYLDLLLPHATWDNPPYRPAQTADPYAEWLGRVYQRWTEDGRPVPIRLFDSLLATARGGPSLSEAVGLDPVDLLVIETDGTWEQADSLKAAYHGAPATGLNVFAHSVDEVATIPGFAARQGGLSSLAAACRACPVVHICGGGLYAHRYSSANGFDNRSVYCDDLKGLIGRVLSDMNQPTVPSGALPTHSLSAEDFAALAAGPGSVQAVSALAEMRLSRTRILVAQAAEAAREAGSWKDGRLRDAAGAGWELLCALDAEHPEAVNQILAHPYTYAWALRCLSPPPDADRDLDLAHLGGLAAAAAVGAGVDARLSLPVRDGQVHVPATGALTVGNGAGPVVPVTIRAGRVEAGGHGWQPARRLAGPGMRLGVEDLDPFRDCQTWPAAARLSDREWQAWRRGLGDMAARLHRLVPAYARTVEAGLRAVVPLRPAPAAQRSGSASQAFGAVAVALPDRPGELDALVVHEFQHVKLHAIMNLRQLTHPGVRQTLRVPWREGHRPLNAVLHGVYAHLALAHLHLARGPAERALYLRYRGWVRETAAALTATGALTSDGEQFVAGMRAAVETGR